MQDTLTCSPATFSQVFGRQGQLMQASEYKVSGGLHDESERPTSTISI